VEDLAGFSFRVYHTGTGDTATTLPAHVMAWVGYTTQDNDLVPLALQVDTTGSSAVAGAPGWYSTKVKPADLLIQGARYLIIGLDPTTRGTSDTQIGAVAVSELKSHEPRVALSLEQQRPRCCAAFPQARSPALQVVAAGRVERQVAQTVLSVRGV
jgi:hypothetical protein